MPQERYMKTELALSGKKKQPPNQTKQKWPHKQTNKKNQQNKTPKL